MSHPLQGRKRVTFQDMMDYGWILPPPETTLRRQIDLVFLDHGLSSPINAVESVSFLANRSLLVAAAHGASGPVCHLELQLHQALLTRLAVEEGELRVTAHSDTGLFTLIAYGEGDPEGAEDRAEAEEPLVAAVRGDQLDRVGHAVVEARGKRQRRQARVAPGQLRRGIARRRVAARRDAGRGAGRDEHAAAEDRVERRPGFQGAPPRGLGRGGSVGEDERSRLRGIEMLVLREPLGVRRRELRVDELPVLLRNGRDVVEDAALPHDGDARAALEGRERRLEETFRRRGERLHVRAVGHDERRRSARAVVPTVDDGGAAARRGRRVLGEAADDVDGRRVGVDAARVAEVVARALAVAFDLRGSPAVTSVKDQGPHGYCGAFGRVASAEGQYGARSGFGARNLSVEQLIDCVVPLPFRRHSICNLHGAGSERSIPCELTEGVSQQANRLRVGLLAAHFTLTVPSNCRGYVNVAMPTNPVSHGRPRSDRVIPTMGSLAQFGVAPVAH